MNTTDLVHYLVKDVPIGRTAKRPSLPSSYHELAAPVRNSILRARHYLQGEQRMDGAWAGRKTGDISRVSQFVLLFAYLGRERDELVEQATRAILRDQRPEGGWSLTPGGPMDLSASVLAYFALKVAGEKANLPETSRARQAIRDRGGADAADMTTRRWLALLGQIDFDHCRPIVPESMLSLVNCSCGERQLAAMAIVPSLRPRCDIELARGVRELFIEQPSHWPTTGVGSLSRWTTSAWRFTDRSRFAPLRKCTRDGAASLLASAVFETREASFEETVWQRIALDALSFDGHSPEANVCESRLKQQLAIGDEHDEACSQPNAALTADTALAIEALRVSGLGLAETAVAAGMQWLVDHRSPPAHDRDNYAEMAAILRAIAGGEESTQHAAAALPPDLHTADCRATRTARRPRRRIDPPSSLERLAARLSTEFLSRQQADGGWSPWTGPQPNRRSRGVVRANDRQPPHESAPDVTGAIVEVLSFHGLQSVHPAAVHAAAFLRISQRADGSWDSAIGARLLHGTTWAIRGLVSAGASPNDPAIAAGVNWLFMQQQESGGWGEAVGCDSQPRDYVVAVATALQTAWAILALVVAGHADHDATRRGVEFLVDRQHDDGRWCDSQFTVRDSAVDNWHRNDLHSAAVPLVALARWAVAMNDRREEEPASLRLVCEESSV